MHYLQQNTPTLFLHSFAHDSKWTKWWVPHTLKHSSCCSWGHLCSPVVLWSREGPAWCCPSSWAPLESTGGCCWARCPISCAPIVVSKSLPAACSTLGIKQPTTRVQPAVVWAFQCENSSFCKCNWALKCNKALIRKDALAVTKTEKQNS